MLDENDITVPTLLKKLIQRAHQNTKGASLRTLKELKKLNKLQTDKLTAEDQRDLQSLKLL